MAWRDSQWFFSRLCFCLFVRNKQTLTANRPKHLVKWAEWCCWPPSKLCWSFHEPWSISSAWITWAIIPGDLSFWRSLTVRIRLNPSCALGDVSMQAQQATLIMGNMQVAWRKSSVARVDISSVPTRRVALNCLEKLARKCNSGNPWEPPPKFWTNLAMAGTLARHRTSPWLACWMASGRDKPFSKAVATWSATSNSLIALEIELDELAAICIKLGSCGMASSMDAARTTQHHPCSIACQAGSDFAVEQWYPSGPWMPFCRQRRKATLWLPARLRKPAVEGTPATTNLVFSSSTKRKALKAKRALPRGLLGRRLVRGAPWLPRQVGG